MHVLFYLRFLKLFPLSFVYLSWQVGFEIWFAKRMWFHWVQLSPLNHGMQREMIQWFQKIDAMISIEDLRIRRCWSPCGFFFFEWPPLEKIYGREKIHLQSLDEDIKRFLSQTPGCDRRSLQMFEYVNWKKWLLRYGFFPQQPGGIQHFTNWTRSPGNHGYHLGQTSSRQVPAHFTHSNQNSRKSQV